MTSVINFKIVYNSAYVLNFSFSSESFFFFFCILDDLYLSGESFRVVFSFKQVVFIKRRADGYGYGYHAL